MAKFYKEVLVVDVESTCWDPPETKPNNAESEIIEIGVTGVDVDKLETTFNKSIIVRPQKSTVSEFCTKLTTLTQEDVNKGINYHSACERLEREYNSRRKMMVSWGDYDRIMFEKFENDKYPFGHRYPFGRRHLNLKATFALLYGLDKEMGMDQALKYIGIPLDGTHHRGVDDSKNIAKILIHVLKKFRLNM